MPDDCSPRWVVYASAGRERSVKAVSELKPFHAAMFGALPHVLGLMKMSSVREALAAFVSRGGAQVDESLMRLAKHDALSSATSSN